MKVDIVKVREEFLGLSFVVVNDLKGEKEIYLLKKFERSSKIDKKIIISFKKLWFFRV